MGMYLDSKTAYILYRNEVKKPYFVDKSEMLGELFPLMETGGEYICITRPRRFGKTVMANMIGAFFNRVYDTGDVFDSLAIAGHSEYIKYRNQFPVIHIPFNDVMKPCQSYEDYIGRIERQLIMDLKAAYPDVRLDGEKSAVTAMLNILEVDDTARFVFVLDEWDFIFHQSFVTENNKKEYLLFLRNLLKDRPYVLMVYMTGILPVAKYSSGSELNMFLEYTMATEERFSTYFGFTEEEVDKLFELYCTRTSESKQLTREGLKTWYDGYYTKSGKRLYNPRSVVTSLKNNNLGNYWTSSGPYDEIFYYIEHNVAAVRDDLALMVARESERMLEATMNGDTKTMTEILELVHNTEVPLLSYNNEIELTAIVNLVYLSARDTYRVEREDKAGKGYVDFIFYPEADKNADCIILELKVGHTPEEAIQQIKEKQYALRFQGRIAEAPRYTGRILAVGISYDREGKKHCCKIEVL